MYVFINGDFISNKRSCIQSNDRGFLLGDGLFETLKVHNGRPIFFNSHYNRLYHSAAFLDIPLKYSMKALEEICNNLIIKNKLSDTVASIRITLTRGVGARGISIPAQQDPSLLITASDLSGLKNTSTSMRITSIQRNQHSPITRHKTLNYLEPILARKEANKAGFDDGIMLNVNGMVTESSVANLFFVKNAQVITPPINCGILPGIVREKVILLCQKNQIAIVEKNILPGDIATMDELFQTNSLIDIQKIGKVDNAIFNSERFEITELIAKLYKRLIYT